MMRRINPLSKIGNEQLPDVTPAHTARVRE